jgi:hypothetical protein
MTTSAKNLVATVAFFDMFNYPLTAWELFRLSPEPTDFNTILNELKTLPEQLEHSQGFYFLSGRSNIIAKRKTTYNLANAKNKIALKTVKKLSWLPGLKMTAVCNNFYYTPSSDIDIFIIAQAERLWLSRLLITCLTHLLGRRRHGRQVADRLCLSFYVSEADLNLKSATLETDPYFYYWLAFLLPLSGQTTYQKFWQANNWLEAKLPNLKPIRTNKIFYSSLSLPIHNFWFNLSFGAWLEKLAKNIQTAKMTRNTSSLAQAHDTRVIISDTMLKFHENDRRAEFLERYQDKLKNLGVYII